MVKCRGRSRLYVDNEQQTVEARVESSVDGQVRGRDKLNISKLWTETAALNNDNSYCPSPTVWGMAITEGKAASKMEKAGTCGSNPGTLSKGTVKDTAPQEMEELCFLTAQSMTSLVTSEHFKLVKKLGEGSYGKVMLAVHQKRGTPMALKFFPRSSTTLQAFLREYSLSLCYCTHPSLTRALGIFYSTPSHYVFAQEAGLYGDLYEVIVSEVSVH
ncbi:hypothetical protein DNTS_001173 [Danionella cerebrum]|uniref:Protein kinase domain-containing protein n=1 Tax=Danionella cerebrum TaxID=2873325 RepID=A0A553NJC4_9TELE|nr:hypothetical protein DNTS_001173 [Danionella translucida]